jgi:hypothetical protein
MPKTTSSKKTNTSVSKDEEETSTTSKKLKTSSKGPSKVQKRSQKTVNDTPSSTSEEKGSKKKNSHSHRRAASEAIPIEAALMHKLRLIQSHLVSQPEKKELIHDAALVIAENRGLSNTKFEYAPHEIRFSKSALHHQSKFLLMVLKSIIDKIRNIPFSLDNRETISTRKLCIAISSVTNVSLQEVCEIEKYIHQAKVTYQSKYDKKTGKILPEFKRTKDKS